MKNYGFRAAAAILLGCVCACSGFAGDIGGKVTAEGIKSMASMVVYIDGFPTRTSEGAAGHAAVHQKNMTFIPHVLPVVQGTTVDFWNDDPVQHAVSWPSVAGNRKLAHYLGVWPQGEMRSFTFNDLGAVPLLCPLHPEMSGYVIVVPTAYYALTDDDGNFTIKDVPPGDYTLKVWSEEGEQVLQTVHVADASTTVRFTVRRAARR